MNNNRRYIHFIFIAIAIAMLAIIYGPKQLTGFGLLIDKYGGFIFWPIWLFIAYKMFTRLKSTAKNNYRNQQIQEQISFAPILYKSSKSSGCSLKSLKTKFGGARNCLKIVITDENLFITSPGILAAFSQKSDLEHIIPKSSIQSINRQSIFLTPTSYLISYKDELEEIRNLQLWPRKYHEFEQALLSNETVIPKDIISSKIIPSNAITSIIGLLIQIAILLFILSTVISFFTT
jgi:hypothetical protein